MKPSLLSWLVAAACASPAALLATPQTPPRAESPPADAAPGTADAKPAAKEAKQLDTVRVTGSLIPRAQIEGASPISTLRADDIDKQGFGNLFDAIRSLPQSNGSVQDSQSTGGYTPGAKTISLFGLSPSYTLTLLNGRPMANYPLAYDGNTSIVDIANIPLGMVDHVDVLTGGQSSVYGSSAIAGVVNIVLKDRIEGTHLRFRVGDYSDGGGVNQRFVFSSGRSFGDLDLSYGLELSKQKPIYGYQRTYTDSLADNPTDGPIDPSRTFLRQNQTQGATAYIDPGAQTCNALAYLYGGTTTYAHRDAPGTGNYCGSLDNNGTATLLNKSKSANASVFARYHVTADTELYSDLLYSYSRPTYSGGSPFWNQSFYNQTSGQYELWQRIFAPEEVGLAAKDQQVFTHSYNAVFGLRGPLGASRFNYDVYFNRSQSDAIRKSTDFLAANGIDAYYLGPQLGTDAAGYAIFAPHLDRLYRPINRPLYDGFSGLNRAASEAWTQSLTAIVNTASLFELPAGPVGFAAIAQRNHERFSNQSSAPDSAQRFRGQGGSTTAQGSRDLSALGMEFQVPIFDTFSSNLSARYDKYSFDGGGTGKLTYKLGLEYRPTDSLLLRGSYATAFRSPDMFYLFSTQSSGFTTQTDYFKCRSAGFDSDSYENCPQSGISVLSTSRGNRDLDDITAKTFTYGAVWSTSDNKLSVSLDYNAVRIDDEVEILDAGDILTTEANCRLGVSENGSTPFDVNSPTCRQVLQQVMRRPANDPLDPNGVQGVSSYPINIANQRQTGVQSTLNYRWDSGRWGDFDLDLGYYRVLSHSRQTKEGDPTQDQLCCANSNELHNRSSASLSWHKGAFTSTLYGLRNAQTWNAAGDARDIGPWTTWNGTVNYRVNDMTSLLLSVNNIANQRPPIDRTNGGWPFYDTGVYNAYGRSVSLELSLDFGG